MNDWPCFMNYSCVSGSGARVTLAVSSQFLFGCQVGPRRCLLAVHSSLPVASAPLLLVLLFHRLFCPVVSGFFLSYPFSLILLVPFVWGGGGGEGVSPLICCDSCHCEAPTEFLPWFPAPHKPKKWC